MKHGSDKRRATRVSVGYDILYKVEGQPEEDLKYGRCTHVFDLSQGGMSICRETPLAIGTQLDITFHVIFKHRQSHPMEVKGKVAYCVPIPGKDVYRLGIEFINILPSSQEEIAALVKSKTSKE